MVLKQKKNSNGESSDDEENEEVEVNSTKINRDTNIL